MKVLAKRSLFWDVNDVDPEKNKKFILERILGFGDMEDFFWALKFYGKEEIKEILLKSRALDSKSSFFWRQYFNIDQKICLKNQLAKRQSWFWKN